MEYYRLSVRSGFHLPHILLSFWELKQGRLSVLIPFVYHLRAKDLDRGGLNSLIHRIYIYARLSELLQGDLHQHNGTAYSILGALKTTSCIYFTARHTTTI